MPAALTQSDNDRDIASTVTAAAGANVIRLYDYDAADARTKAAKTGASDVDYTYDPGHRIATAGGDDFTHFVDGTQTVAGAQRYHIDALGRLTSVTDAPGTTTFNAFTYDPLGRVASITDGAAATRTLSYFGPELWQESVGGSAIRQMTRHPQMPGSLITHVSGESYASLCDARSNLLASADSSGSIQHRYRYEPFGVPSSSTSPTTTGLEPTFGGMRYLADSGLYLAGQRLMNPEHGLWVSPDAAGYLDSPDLYAYTCQNPIDLVDPDGTSSDKATPTTNNDGFFTWPSVASPLPAGKGTPSSRATSPGASGGTGAGATSPFFGIPALAQYLWPGSNGPIGPLSFSFAPTAGAAAGAGSLGLPAAQELLPVIIEAGAVGLGVGVAVGLSALFIYALATAEGGIQYGPFATAVLRCHEEAPAVSPYAPPIALPVAPSAIAVPPDAWGLGVPAHDPVVPPIPIPIPFPIPMPESIARRRTDALDKIFDLVRRVPTGRNLWLYELVATRDGWYPVVAKHARRKRVFLHVGEVWKYGQSNSPDDRYPRAELAIGLRMKPLFEGPEYIVLAMEKLYILGYALDPTNLNRPDELGGFLWLPPGNRIIR